VFEIMDVYRNDYHATDEYRKNGGKDISVRVDKESRCTSGDSPWIWELYGDYVNFMDHHGWVGVNKITVGTRYKDLNDHELIANFHGHLFSFSKIISTPIKKLT
jgi:hypothetical protein